MKGRAMRRWATAIRWWLVPIGSGLAFAALAVAARLVPPFPGESVAFQNVQGLRSAGLDNAALVVSWTASAAVASLALGAVALAFAAARRWPEAVAAVVLLAVEGVGYLAKLAVARPRPLSLLGVEASHTSFPSGHALQAFLLFGFLICLLGGQVTPRWLGRALQVALAVPIVMVGLARVYLGEHWPSDVVGAYLLGAAGLGLAVWVAGRMACRPEKVKPPVVSPDRVDRLP